MSTSNICYYVEKGPMPEIQSSVSRLFRFCLVFLLSCWTWPALALALLVLPRRVHKKMGLALRECVRAITET